jgi:seryl-tRNA synthetase
VTHIENKIEELHYNMIRDSNTTKETISNMKSDVDQQMKSMKLDTLDTKEEMKTMNTSLDDVKSMLTKLFVATLPTETKNKTPKHRLEDEIEDSDINMTDLKQHDGMRVTRSNKIN